MLMSMSQELVAAFAMLVIAVVEDDSFILSVGFGIVFTLMSLLILKLGSLMPAGVSDEGL